MLKNKPTFLKRNIELIFGIILIIVHAIVWFLPAYFLGANKVNNYNFLSLFPMWFVYSSFGSFIVVISLIIIFITLSKSD